MKCNDSALVLNVFDITIIFFHKILQRDPNKEFICSLCFNNLNIAYDFKQLCDKTNLSNQNGRHLLDNGKEFLIDFEIDATDGYQCDICDQKFSKKGLVQTHLQLHRIKSKQYQCECNRRFIVKTKFKMHQKNCDKIPKKMKSKR